MLRTLRILPGESKRKSLRLRGLHSISNNARAPKPGCSSGLPVPDEPLVWLLLRQGIQKLGYDGASIKELREADGGSRGG